MRTRIFVRLAVIAGLVFLLTGEVSAHGTGYRHSEFRAVALEFMYSTGEAMSYREARVFSPEDDKFAYQSGRTDEKGRFAFVPDVPGKWRVIVRDEEGHQCIAEVTVDSVQGAGGTDKGLGSRDKGESSLLQGKEIFLRAILGVSLIFNVAMIIRRKHAHK